MTGGDLEARRDRWAAGLAGRLLSPDGSTRARSTFDRRDLLRAVCEALPAGTAVDVADLEAVTDRVLALPAVVAVAAADDDGPRWTTVGMLQVEADRPGHRRHAAGRPAAGRCTRMWSRRRSPGSTCTASTRPWSGP